MTEDPRVIAAIRRSRQDAENAYLHAQPYFEALDLEVAWEEWVWATAVVSSRALSLQGNRVLAPMMDMINYSPQPTSLDRPSDQGKLYAKYHRYQVDGLRVFSDRLFDEIGAQYFEDYGDNANSIYFQHHGFIPHDNPHDCVYITVDALHSRHNYDSPEIKERKGEIFKKVATKQLKIRAPPYEICMRETGNVPHFLNYYIGIWALEGEKLDKCEQIVKIGGNPKHICQPDDLKLSKDKILIMAIEDRLKHYHSTLQDDIELLKSSDLTEHERLAIQYRYNQKRILYSLRENWCEELGDECPEVTKQHIEEGIHPTHEIHENMEHPDTDEATQQQIIQALASADPYFTKEQDLDQLIEEFNVWFAKFDPPVSKLRVQKTPGMRLGTIATEPIKHQELYLSVPLEAVLDYKVAKDHPIVGPFLSELGHLTSWRHDMDLVIFLLYEKFVEGQDSAYAPYLNMLPSLLEAQESPLFYDKTHLDLLHGSDVQLEVLNYQDQVKEFYKKFSNSMHAAGFGKDTVSYHLFAWAQYILDTRSIWWGGERHLVPMLDMINCLEGPDPEVVHKTDLDATGKYADTFAPWDFNTGDEVFENYGQANHIYFVYHGFILEENTHDCVFMSLPTSLYPNSQLNQFFPKRPGFCVSPDQIPTGFLMFFRLGEKINMNVDSSEMNSIEPELAVPLVKFFERKYKGYATDEEFLAIEKGGDLSMEHKFIISEKKMVSKLLEMAKSHLTAKRHRRYSHSEL